MVREPDRMGMVGRPSDKKRALNVSYGEGVAGLTNPGGKTPRALSIFL